MNEFEKATDKAADAADNAQQGLVKMEQSAEEKAHDYATELKAQAEEYGQKLQDAAYKAKDYATEKYNAANDKLNEWKQKDPKELVEDAKDFARKNPGQTILVSAAVGLILGFLIKGRR